MIGAAMLHNDASLIFFFLDQTRVRALCDFVGPLEVKSWACIIAQRNIGFLQPYALDIDANQVFLPSP